MGMRRNIAIMGMRRSIAIMGMRRSIIMSMEKIVLVDVMIIITGMIITTIMQMKYLQAGERRRPMYLTEELLNMP